LNFTLFALAFAAIAAAGVNPFGCVCPRPFVAYARRPHPESGWYPPSDDDDDDDDDDVGDAVLLVAIVVVSGTVGNDAHPQKEDCIGDDDDDHESTSPRFAVARLAAPSIARRIVLWVAQK
jgi:hypothetical protein|tara:strand:- start:245 stop:607 length:363 start_codon:yes stop_codon:yes gene_type:complete